MPAISFQRLFDEIESLYKPPRRRKATWFKMRTVLREIQALPGVRKSSDLTPLTICRWVEAHASRRAITNRSYLGSLRVACKYAAKMNYLKTDPWAIRSDWVPEDDQTDDDDADEETTLSARHCSIPEILRLLDVLDDGAKSGSWVELRLQALGYTYAYTGMRKMEALGLKTTDLDLKRGVVQVRSRRKRKLKNRASARLIGLAGELRRVLETWLPVCGSEWLFPGKRRTKPWFHGSNGVRPLDEMKAAGTRAGIENLTIHGLRRSLATHAGRMGLGLEDAQHILGHASPQTTREWYIEQDVANSAAIGDRISYRAFLPGVENPN